MLLGAATAQLDERLELTSCFLPPAQPVERQTVELTGLGKIRDLPSDRRQDLASFAEPLARERLGRLAEALLQAFGTPRADQLDELGHVDVDLRRAAGPLPHRPSRRRRATADALIDPDLGLGHHDLLVAGPLRRPTATWRWRGHCPVVTGPCGSAASRDHPSSATDRTHPAGHHLTDHHLTERRCPAQRCSVHRPDASHPDGRNRPERHRSGLLHRPGSRPRTDDVPSRSRAGWIGWNRSCQQSSHTWRETSDRTRYPQLPGASQFVRPEAAYEPQTCHERKPKGFRS